jgi:uncharacterized protein YjiS (DUF1127 family)
MQRSLTLLSPTFAPQSGFGRWVPARLQKNRLVALLLTWDARWRTRRGLEHMSDHMLEDIGLTRTEVSREIHKTFWQP